MMALPPEKRDQAMHLIERSERILVIPHDNVDPDGLSSALAICAVLTSLGKDVHVTCPGEVPEFLSFLPGFHDLRAPEGGRDLLITLRLPEGTEVEKLRYAVEDHRLKIIVTPTTGRIPEDRAEIESGEPPYDLLIVVDTADLSLLGSFARQHSDLLEEVPILNIDHHISNTGFGHLQLIDYAAASATEILTNWFLQDPSLRDRVTPDVASLLLTGLITDTRSFQNPNTTPQSFETAAALIDRGARQQEIIKHIYKTKPLSTLRIWGRALKNLQVDTADRIVWSLISGEDLQEMGAKSNETTGIIDELLTTLPDMDLFVLFTEVEEGGLKASLRSSEAIDASRIAGLAYGGGGHARAAGFKIQSYDNFALQVVECVKRLKEEIRKQREAEVVLPKAEGPGFASGAEFTPSGARPDAVGRVEGPRQEESPLPKVPRTKSIDVVEEISKEEK